MIKLFFISLVFLFLLDNPVRAFISRINTPFLSEFMGWASYMGLGWIQALLCLSLFAAGLIIKKDTVMQEAGKKGLYSIAFAGILAQVIKHLIGRPRPGAMDTFGLSLGPSLASGFHSFPSGHAASAFALASSLSMFYPGMRLPLYVYAAVVAVSRVFVDSHFLSDIYAGAVLGLWISWVVVTKKRADIKRMLNRHGAVLGLIALSIFLFFYNLGAHGLFDIGEAVFAESAREMMESGNWITPEFNYAGSHDKPILFYWLISSAYVVFGLTEFAARFWPAVCGIALVLSPFYLLRRLGHYRWGVLSALILATSLPVIVMARAAVTDIVLTFFMTAALAGFFLGYIDEGRNKKWFYTGFFVAMALAVVTGGPLNIMIPVLVILPFLLLRGQLGETLKDMHVLSGGLMFLVVALPWYLINIGVNGWEYIYGHFISGNTQRHTGFMSDFSLPFYYFIPVILLTLFPWSAFLPYTICKSFPRGMARGNLTYKESMTLFAVLWFVAVIIFFSFINPGMPYYIVPLSPVAAILAGNVWDEYIRQAFSTGVWMKLSVLFLVIMSLLLAAGLSLTPGLLEESETVTRLFNGPIDAGNGFYYIGAGIAAGTCLFIIAVWRYKKRVAFGIMIGMMTLAASLLLTHVMPVADKYLQSTLRDFARVAAAELDNEGDLVVYGLNRPSVVFYARRPALIVDSETKDSLTEIINSSSKAYIISKSSHVPEFMDYPEIFLLYEQRGYALSTTHPPPSMLRMDRSGGREGKGDRL